MIMLETLHNHAPNAEIHILCLSEECFKAMQKLDYTFVRIYTLEELEAYDSELAAVKHTRSVIEYYFTITPCFPFFLIQKYGLQEITYLDADLMFFSSPEPIFEEAGNAQVIITPHRFSPSLAARKLERFGLYNVGWLTFCNGESGIACLQWYRKACLTWCYDRLEEDRFADQKYLDTFPRNFSDVYIMQHKGAGVAPWNLGAGTVSSVDNLVMIDGVPLIFYHAHNFNRIIGPLYSSGFLQYKYKPAENVIKYILISYIEHYKKALRVIKINGFNISKINMRYNANINLPNVLIKELRNKTLLLHF
jgi:hypothetical protein